MIPHKSSGDYRQKIPIFRCPKMGLSYLKKYSSSIFNCFNSVCSGPFGFSAGGGAFSDEDIAGGRNITAIKIRVGKQRNMVSIQVSSGERVSVHLDWSLL